MSESKTVEVAGWVPDYTRGCENCGNKPVVTGVDERNKVVYQGTLCGPCTWGEADTADPTNW